MRLQRRGSSSDEHRHFSSEDEHEYGLIAQAVYNVKKRKQEEKYGKTEKNEKTEKNLRRIRKVEKKIDESNTNWVKVKIGDIITKVFTDSGSDANVIPPSMYKHEMGRMEETGDTLRAYGGERLDLKGIIRDAWVTNKKGLGIKTDLYIVDGYQNEPLLSEEVSTALGFIQFNPEGREPTDEDILTTFGFSPESTFEEYGEYRPHLGSTWGVQTTFGEYTGSTIQNWVKYKE